jgi:hypothetical protein
MLRSVDVIEPGRWLAPNPRPPVARGVRARLAGAAGVADLALDVGTIAPPGERTMAPPGERTIAPPRVDAAGAAFLALGFRAGFAAGAAGAAAFRALGFRAGFSAGAAAGAFRARGFLAGFSFPATARFGPPLTPRVPSNRVT